MSLYNIVNAASLQGGQPEDVSQVLANLQAIQTILNGGIDDANVRSTAAINISKLNVPANINQVPRGDGTWGALPIAALAGYPNDVTKAPRGDGSWANTGFFQKKTTTKLVQNTVAETDLLNGEFTVPAGAMGANGVLRLSALIDWENASGAATANPRYKLKLGATTLIDTGAVAGVIANAGNVYGLQIFAEIMNLGATNSQLVHFHFVALVVGQAFGTVAATTGTGITLVTAGGSWAQFQSNIWNNTAVDTTVAQNLALTTINPVANANMLQELRGAFVEIG